MDWPRLVLAHVVRVGLVVNGTEHQARLVTSSALSAAVAPGAVAPAEASAAVTQWQVVLVVHAGVGFLAEELDDQGL